MTLTPPQTHLNLLKINLFSHQIDQINEAAPKNKDTATIALRVLEMAELGEKLQASPLLTLYPCAGTDLPNATWLFPSSDLLLIDRLPFGREWSIDQRHFLNLRGKDMCDTLDSCASIGHIYLQTIVGTLQGNIEGVYFFSLSEEGQVRFHSSDQLECENALIVYNGKKVWYIKKDFTDDSDTAFRKFCENLSLNERVGNIFIKAVYPNVRYSPLFQKMLDIKAERYISDAEGIGQYDTYTPCRFPEEHTEKIDVTPYVKSISDRKFCYEQLFFTAPFLNNNKINLLEVQDKIKELQLQWENHGEHYHALALALAPVATKTFLDKLNDSHKTDFKNRKEVRQFFLNMDSELTQLEQSLNCLQFPMKYASTEERLIRDLKASEATLAQIGQLLGLANKLSEKFAHNKEAFFSSKQTLFNIYQELKSQRANRIRPLYAAPAPPPTPH